MIDKIKFTKEHLWVRENENGTFDVGVTEHAIDKIGSIQFAEFPQVARYYINGDVFCSVEATKNVMMLKCPFNGECIHSIPSEEAQNVSDCPMEVPFARFRHVTDFDGITEEQYKEFISNGENSK